MTSCGILNTPNHHPHPRDVMVTMLMSLPPTPKEPTHSNLVLSLRPPTYPLPAVIRECPNVLHTLPLPNTTPHPPPAPQTHFFTLAIYLIYKLFTSTYSLSWVEAKVTSYRKATHWAWHHFIDMSLVTSPSPSCLYFITPPCSQQRFPHLLLPILFLPYKIIGVWIIQGMLDSGNG